MPRSATGRRSAWRRRPAPPTSRGRSCAPRCPTPPRWSASPPPPRWRATPGSTRTARTEGEASDEPDDLDAAFTVLREELKGDDLDAALLACRAIELLGARTAPTVRAMRQAADRFADAEGDQALFIRFSTYAFLSRLAVGRVTGNATVAAR